MIFLFLMFQDPEKLLELFQAALSLSTSTKHFDCVTASYLLKFLLYQEGLEAALRDSARGAPNGPNNQTLHIDSTSFLERNTFAG